MEHSGEPYIPSLGIVYPEKPDAHMIPPRKEIDFELKEGYPFLDRSFSFRVRSTLLYAGIFSLVFLLSPLRYGLRIEGRGILKKYRNLFKNGAMTISNHVLRWDFLMALQAVRWRRLYFPAWQENLSGPDRNLIRLAGGIPVPDKISLMKGFLAAFDALHQEKKWMHCFPESANWHYFQPIRPFKKGAFTLALRYNIPVIPMAFSYRPARGIWRLFKGGFPLITLRIGEPLLPDLSLPRREAVNLLRRETHRRIVELAGIKDNPYPAEGD